MILPVTRPVAGAAVSTPLLTPLATGYGTGRIWLTVLVIGVATFALRFSFIFLFGRVEDLPAWLERALRFVPPAVFAVLAVPAVVSLDGGVAGVVDDRLVAAVVAGVVAWRTENVLATIVVGMGVLWTLRFLI